MRLGYACLNETLKTKFRTCRLETFRKEGIDKLRELTIVNTHVVLDTLKWNIENGIYMYRMTSGMVPLATHEEVKWNWWEDKYILEATENVDFFVWDNDIRLTTHPGQYTVLNSPNDKTLANAMADLDYHDKFMNLVCGSDMIIHTGGAYGNKEEAKKRFAENYQFLSRSIKERLRLENDDKTFNVEDVLDIHQMCGIPIVLDIHHHNCNPSRLDIMQYVPHIFQTWGDKPPKVHISSGRSHPLDIAHNDYIKEEDFKELLRIAEGYDVDIMFEAKKKEKSILALKQFTNPLNLI